MHKQKKKCTSHVHDWTVLPLSDSVSQIDLPDAHLLKESVHVFSQACGLCIDLNLLYSLICCDGSTI